MTAYTAPWGLGWETHHIKGNTSQHSSQKLRHRVYKSLRIVHGNVMCFQFHKKNANNNRKEILNPSISNIVIHRPRLLPGIKVYLQCPADCYDYDEGPTLCIDMSSVKLTGALVLVSNKKLNWQKVELTIPIPFYIKTYIRWWSPVFVNECLYLPICGHMKLTVSRVYVIKIWWAHNRTF